MMNLKNKNHRCWNKKILFRAGNFREKDNNSV